MRTDLELLQILKTFLEEKGMDDISGLCNVIHVLMIRSLITSIEFERLQDILKTHLPLRIIDGAYCWPRYELPPRLKFVNELIDKYTNQ